MKLAALISGGVDSSVALALAKAWGHSVTAFYLKIWLEEELHFLGNCPWEEDLSYARSVCGVLGVPLEVIPLQQAYWQRVVDYALAEVRAGRTPNPDLLCNQRVKFGAFLERLEQRGGGYEKIISGHYAKVEEATLGAQQSAVRLLSSNEVQKDQTYFLAGLSQTQLQRCFFPLGEVLSSLKANPIFASSTAPSKQTVREVAKHFGLATQNRRDSQGLCFLGKIKFRDFLASQLGEREGEIVELESGRRLGKHSGYWFYTIGQRYGLGLSGGPWYVRRKTVEDNRVYVSRRRLPSGNTVSFALRALNWIDPYLSPPETGASLWCLVKLRHGARKQAARLWRKSANQYAVTLEEGTEALAEGQFAVFYASEEKSGTSREICLGAGAISNPTTH